MRDSRPPPQGPVVHRPGTSPGPVRFRNTFLRADAARRSTVRGMTRPRFISVFAALVIGGMLVTVAVQSALRLGRDPAPSTTLAAREEIPVRDLVAPQPTEREVAAWHSRLDACRPEQESPTAYESYPVLVCIRDVYDAAAQSLSYEAVGLALDRVVAAHPLFSGPCHLPGHYTGGYFLHAAGGSIRRALYLYDLPSCEAALLHGIIESFSDTYPSDADVGDLVQACEAYRSAQMRVLCAHGAGHGAFNATRQAQEAGRWCALFHVAQYRTACGQGVMMQSFRPSNQKRFHFGMGEATSKIPTICSQWPDQDLPGMVEGCAAGAAYIYAWLGIPTLISISTSLPYPYTDPSPQVLSQVRGAMSVSAQACRSLPEAFAGLCVKSIVFALPREALPFVRSEQVWDAACSAMEEFAEYCRQNKTTLPTTG